MGDRPEEFAAAFASVRAQTGVAVEIVLVVNGAEPDGTAADVVVDPGTNLGIPGGRNRGAEVASAPLMFFMDDDGVLIDDDVLSNAAARFDEDPDLAVVAFRIVDDDGRTARRHHPGLRGNPNRSGEVARELLEDRWPDEPAMLAST